MSAIANMCIATTFTFFILATLCHGIPLQKPSEDMSKFFSSSRIVGGSDAPEDYAPHMAALVVGENYISLVCGGSIVASNLILTAAHCIDMFIIWDEMLPSFHGVVGSNVWNRPGNVVYFKGYHIHPQWDWATIKYDIGFLVLQETLTLGRNIRIMALNLERIETEEPCSVTGWGLLDTFPNDILPYKLQRLYVNTISHERCVDGVNTAAGNLPAPNVDPEIEICTFHSIGHGMCNGDSGSGLVSTKTKSQIGIVSWGFPCAVGAPDIFVRISGFKTYIQDIMAQNS